MACMHLAVGRAYLLGLKMRELPATREETKYFNEDIAGCLWSKVTRMFSNGYRLYLPPFLAFSTSYAEFKSVSTISRQNYDYSLHSLRLLPVDLWMVSARSSFLSLRLFANVWMWFLHSLWPNSCHFDRAYFSACRLAFICLVFSSSPSSKVWSS